MRRRVWAVLLLALFAFGLPAAENSTAQDHLTLALLGDVMLGRGVAQSLGAADGWETAFSAIAPSLAGADLALANLESPLTGVPLQVAALDGQAPFDLRAPPDAARALFAAGLDLVVLANNHALDSGFEGLADTRAALQAYGLAAIGPGSQALYRQVNGQLLAFLAFDLVGDPPQEAEMLAAVAAARRQGALVLVSLHWGLEYQPGPYPAQHRLAQKLAQAGASLIWGHHPHVLQPVAWLSGPEGAPVLVAYSLGNALFDQPAPPDAARSALILVQVKADGVSAVQAVPLQINPRAGQVRLADEREAELILSRLQLSSITGQPGRLVFPVSDQSIPH